MIKKLQKILVSLSLVFAFALPVALPASTLAVNSVQDNVCSGANTLKIDQGSSGCSTIGNTSESLNNKISTVLNLFSVIIGLIAVVMIVVAGFKYITSGGKEEGVKSAKNTILYAIVGLVVVALAQIIVQFVLNKSTSA